MAIRSFRRGDARRLPPRHLPKITAILNALDVARSPRDLVGLAGLHSLRGDRAGFWSATVSRNWRVVFRFDDVGNACDVGFEDYH